ncbi:37797_t:CDS:1 [Gigaspora margarita]|uniref:37797_t:CDS:1 n=1 Tax=Gigaspora margarita TaxID=4874 RepID=A0ABN7WT12_GIGMA|nr:37797_t:CDS:1 [Gigaspora margarita]
MVKYTKECLLKHQIVGHISDYGLYTTCKYEKVVRLKQAYDETYIESHIKNGCKLQEGVVSILNFFSTIPKENKPVIKWFSCNGLDNAIHKAYISRVFTHTTHSGAPRRDTVVKELFSTKFSFDKPIKYKNLSEEEL